MTLAEFWTVTPRETLAFITAAAWRSEAADRRAVLGAWFTELFARQKRLKPVDQVLRKLFGSAESGQDPKARLEEEAEKARGWARRVNAMNARNRKTPPAAAGEVAGS